MFLLKQWVGDIASVVEICAWQVEPNQLRVVAECMPRNGHETWRH